MIRKIIIVVRTLAAVGFGVLGMESRNSSLRWQVWSGLRNHVFLYSRDAIARLIWVESTDEIVIEFIPTTQSDLVTYRAEPACSYRPSHLVDAELFRLSKGAGYHGVDWRLGRQPTSAGPCPSIYWSSIRCPTWTASAAFLAYPLLAFIRGPFRRYRRRKRGLCVTCGYDVRGNESGICSECGTKIEAA